MQDKEIIKSQSRSRTPSLSNQIYQLGMIVTDNLPKTIDEAFDKKTPVLSSLDQDVSVGYLTASIIKSVTTYFNNNNTISPEQSKAAAKLIYNEYPSLRISEIPLVFRMATNGLLGRDARIFGVIDPGKICDFFREYYRLRSEIWAAKYEQKNSSGWIDFRSDDCATPEEAQKAHEQFREIENKYYKNKIRKNRIKSNNHKLKQEKFEKDKLQLIQAVLLSMVLELFFQNQ